MCVSYFSLEEGRSQETEHETDNVGCDHRTANQVVLVSSTTSKSVLNQFDPLEVIGRIYELAKKGAKYKKNVVYANK